MNKFEGVQAQILESAKKFQLVSAGAGSGKTTIMIEKISNLILSGVPIESLLVVTFTVLAASEMKERLINKFKEKLLTCESYDKERILNYIEQVKTASIDTIDGFSSKTIKKYFYELNISPNIEIVSDNTRDFYLSMAMKKTIRDFEKQTDKSNLLLDLFAGNSRNFKPIEEMILSCYYNVISLKNYEDFLVHAQNQYEDSILSEKVINEHMCINAERLKTRIMYDISIFSAEVKNKLNNLIEDLNQLNINISFVSNLNMLYKIGNPKFTPKQYNENIGLKDLVFEINNFFEIKEKLEKNKINENFNENNEKIIKYLNIFIELLKNFIKNYNNLKEKNNLIDFNDLNRLMLKLLNIKEIKDELQNKYKYIFIDEYQDVNPLQDELMSLLTGENTHVFMVGDVKQSIYGFRGASPEWFLNKYKTYKQNASNGVAFDMNNNFRSSPTILEFVNEVFSNLMTVNSADIDYKKDALIEPKRNDIVDDRVKLMFVANKQERESVQGVYSVKEDEVNEEQKHKNQEALLVLKIISELVGTEFYDANLKQTRLLTYKDIAILSRSEKDDAAVSLIELLKENDIPLNLTNKLDVNSSETIKLILSILKCVANTADDVDYLAFFMAMTKMDIDDVVSIRNKETSLYQNLIDNISNDNVLEGFNILDELKKYSYVSSNKELIRHILNENKLRYYLLAKENGAVEVQLIEEFLNKISTVEDCLSLCEFIDVIESNVGGGSDFSSQDNENSVTIQTIHKSKGLEYPVVILYNSSKMFSYIREHEGINFDADIGLGVDYFDVAERIKTYSLTKFAINLKNRESGYKEELRLLYVALTRAKNKLFITGNYSTTALKEKKFKKTSYGNMFLNVFANRINDDYTELKNCTIELIDEVELINNLKINDVTNVEKLNEEFVYPNKDKFNISFKNTVTGLNSKYVEQNKFSMRDSLKPNAQYAYEDKALVGTHYHAVLEKLNLSAEYVKNTDFEDVDYNKIKKAHNVLSNIAKGAMQIYKEADFEMYVPYNDIVDSPISDKVIVQGVVDLIIEYDDYINIVDYKFSSLDIKTLKLKYQEQLLLYKKAVEEAFKKPVRNTFIYSINLGELL